VWCIAHLDFQNAEAAAAAAMSNRQNTIIMLQLAPGC
jgi:hypothetical protein